MTEHAKTENSHKTTHDVENFFDLPVHRNVVLTNHTARVDDDQECR